MQYRLDEIFDLQMGKTPARNNSAYWDAGTHKWISIGDLSGCGKYISDTKESISDRAVQESGISEIPANTVVMSFKLSIGKTAITSEPIYSNEAIMSFRDKHVTEIFPDYIYYLFTAKDWESGTNKAVMGKTLNKATLSTIKIDVPSIARQKEVAAILDKVSLIIDVRKNELQQLDTLIKARFVEMFGDLHYAPSGNWPLKKIGELADVTKLAGFEFTEHIHYQDSGDIIMLRGLNCKHGKLDLTDVKYIDRETSEKLPRSKLHKGDILMTYAGTIGEVAMIDADEKYHLAPNVGKVTIKNQDILNSDFLLHLFMYSHDYIMTFASQVAQASINMQKIRNFEYAIPPIDLQLEFSKFATQVDKSKVAVQKSLDQTQLLMDSLMQQYFG